MARLEEKDMYPYIAEYMKELIGYYHISVNDLSMIRTVSSLRIGLGKNKPEHDILTVFTTRYGINRIYSVEAKLNLNVKGLFDQAKKRCAYCDYCYIAVPLNKNVYLYFNELLKGLVNNSTIYNKIGFMIVDLYSGNCGVIKRAGLNSGLNQSYKEKIFRKIHKLTKDKTNYLMLNPEKETKQILFEIRF